MAQISGWASMSVPSCVINRPLKRKPLPSHQGIAIRRASSCGYGSLTLQRDVANRTCQAFGANRQSAASAAPPDLPIRSGPSVGYPILLARKLLSMSIRHLLSLARRHRQRMVHACPLDTLYSSVAYSGKIHYQIMLDDWRPSAGQCRVSKKQLSDCGQKQSKLRRVSTLPAAHARPANEVNGAKFLP
jgi:hypothetical protein